MKSLVTLGLSLVVTILSRPSGEVMAQDLDLTAQEKVEAYLRVEYRTHLTEVFSSMSETERRHLESEVGVPIHIVVEMAAQRMPREFPGAYQVPEDVARRLLRGEFRDHENLAFVDQCIAIFSEFTVPLPTPLQALIDLRTRDSLTGWRLELARNLLGELKEKFQEALKRDR